MKYKNLRFFRDQLAEKTNKTEQESALLKELLDLDYILNREDFSLSKADTVCDKCGRPFK